MDALIRHGAKARLITDTSPASLDHMSNDHHTDLVLVDSYDIDADYLREAGKLINGAKLAYIDDLERIDLSENGLVDVVISYLPEPDEKRYSGVEYRLLGPMYAPLREEFCISDNRSDLSAYENTGNTASSHLNKHDNDNNAVPLLLTSGATDRYHWKKELLHRLLPNLIQNNAVPCMDIQSISIVAGSYETLSEYLDILDSIQTVSAPIGDRSDKLHTGCLTQDQLSSSISEYYTNRIFTCSHGSLTINLYQNVTDMALLMRSSRLAVSGGGTTLYELCAMGVPTIIRPGSDWEQNFVSAMSRASGMPLVHDIDQTLSELTSLMMDPTSRIALASRMHTLTDGHGADRIANALINIVNG